MRTRPARMQCTSFVIRTIIGRDDSGITHSAMLCTSSSSLQSHRSKGVEKHSRNCTAMKCFPSVPRFPLVPPSLGAYAGCGWHFWHSSAVSLIDYSHMHESYGL